MITSCKHRTDNRCTKGFFGGEPSIGTCLHDCKDYDGPERTPEFIAGVVQATIAAGPRCPATWEDIQAYLAAEWSLQTDGPVHIEQYWARLAQCKGKTVDPTDGREYCEKCVCGTRERAKLDNKMHMPNLTCAHCGITPQPGQGRAELARIGGASHQSIETIKSMAGGIWDIVKQKIGVD